MPKEVMISHGLLVSLLSIRVVVKLSFNIVGVEMIGYIDALADNTSYDISYRIPSVVH
jgi:hypothetical protein